MNIATLEISPEEAKAKLEEYVEQIATERTAEDEAIALGYRSAARGLPVVILPQVIEAGGWFEATGLPRLAIVRADATECFVYRDSWRDPVALIYTDGATIANRGALLGAHSVRVVVADAPREIHHTSAWNRAKTIVPTIPPSLRPRRNRLRYRHILWEVESWSSVPPKDPALLRHIRGDLWAVEAVWDLTALERAVLTQRARP